MELSVIIGFASLAILCITNLIVIGIWIGSNNASNKKRDGDIQSLQEIAKEHQKSIYEMRASLHNFDVIHMALKTQADALNLLTSTLSEHVRTAPTCGLHIEIEKGATKRDTQIEEIQREIGDLKRRN